MKNSSTAPQASLTGEPSPGAPAQAFAPSHVVSPVASHLGADATEIKDWLRLTQCPGVGPSLARRLLEAFGVPARIFATPAAQLTTVAPQRAVRALLAPPDDAFEQVLAATLAWVDAADGIVLTLADKAYPPALLELTDPPPMLFCRGDIGRLSAPAVAIVGSRRATPQGCENARHFARTLGDAGLLVVSGLAAGVDAAAHRGALDTSGGTCAVTGTGLDIVYPSVNRGLAAQIAQSGVLISPFPPGTPPRPEHFPQRNRLIAALGRCTVVAEAAERSGSLITARLAAELGRDVLALPGSIHSPLSRGAHALIREGAILASTPDDVLEVLGMRPEAPPPDRHASHRRERRAVTRPSGASAGPARSPAGNRPTRHPDRAMPHTPTPPSGHTCPASPPPADLRPCVAPGGLVVLDALVEALGYDPVSVDTLCVRTGLTAPTVLQQLTLLELDGALASLPGGLYQRLIPRR